MLKNITTLCITIILSLPLSTLSLVAQTQPIRQPRIKSTTPKPKLAPDLATLLAQDEAEAAEQRRGRRLSEIRQERLNKKAPQALATAPDEETARTLINGVALPSGQVAAEEKQSFILQLTDTTPAIVAQEKIAALGGRISRKIERLGLVVIEAPRTAIRQLAAQGSIAYVSPDRPIQANGHVENTTGAAQVRSLALLSPVALLSSLSVTAFLDGIGVGIAIIDSGLDGEHNLVRSGLTHPGVIKAISFLPGSPATQDYYGHGSHVASIATGGGDLKAGYYKGIAPGAKLLSLRVLDNNGNGSASAVIAAIDWCIANKDNPSYNLRVLNLSLGTRAKDSYVNDPLCQAARRAVDAGLIVVAAAGNDGKDINGHKVYGGIHAPGIDPSVITVGASNTFGTDKRSDDVVTTYSSRGPTRGYRTDAHGIRHYDNLIKPDLVAPGNKLIAASSKGALGNGNNYNNILKQYPSLLADTGQQDQARLMYLSGTSMSAPLVSSAIALMLQAHPKLTPSLVKAILMYSAQPLKGANMFEQGAGLLNVDGAVRVARLVKSPLPSKVGAPLLTTALPTQQSIIAGEACKWGQGVITNWGFLYGSRLMTQWQSVYAPGSILADATSFNAQRLQLQADKVSSGVSFYPGAVNLNNSGSVLVDGIMLADGNLLADGIMLADGNLLADGIMLADGILMADGNVLADGGVRGNNAYLGDNTPCMRPAR